jgi:hypothetical protein
MPANLDSLKDLGKRKEELTVSEKEESNQMRTYWLWGFSFWRFTEIGQGLVCSHRAGLDWMLHGALFGGRYDTHPQEAHRKGLS